MGAFWTPSVAATALVFAAACGSTVDGGGSGGQGGSGGSGAGGGQGGQGGEVPAECAVDTSAPAPYAVTFRFTNPGGAPVYMREDCVPSYAITSCADGYSEPLSLSGACSLDCADPSSGCIVCGACPLGSVEIAPGLQVTDGWSGHHYTFNTLADGCTCHDQHVTPAGKYRIQVPVFASDAEALDGAPTYQVTVDFELPAPDGVVEVPLTQP